MNGMAVPDDWTTGPAKRLSVFLLGAAVILGMAHSIFGGRKPWTVADPSAQPAQAGPAPMLAVTADEPTSATTRPAPAAAQVIVNINTADKAQLELLPRIGPSLADRIIAERERGGPFRTLEDLGRVRGIGAKTIERLRGFAVVE